MFACLPARLLIVVVRCNLPGRPDKAKGIGVAVGVSTR